MSIPSRIYLIGFMGAGKTTLGRALTAFLPGKIFVDLDEEIEAEAGLTVTEIFSRFGEDYFRELETAVLKRTSRQENLILAVGGGTPCFGNNMALMKESGLTVLLEAENETIMRRLLDAQAQRPKLNGLDAEGVKRFVVETLKARNPFYRQAHSVFPSDRLETAEEIAQSCRSFLKLLQGYEVMRL